MKYPVIPILILVLALMPSGHAAFLKEWNITISLNEDKTSVWQITQVYNETITKTDYFILADIFGYTVTGDGKDLPCLVSTGPGSLITCDNMQAKTIEYTVNTGPVINDILQQFRLFTHKFSVIQQTDSFTLMIRLPFGAGLAEAKRLQGTGLKPFEPESGIRGSDGRHIFVTWRLNGPVIGTTLDVAVVYEQFSEQIEFTLFAVIISVAVVAFLVFMLVTRHKHVQNILPVLTNNERKVVEILLKGKGEVDQRAIVKETDFSKAKVSRVISDLVKRGIIEKISKGRKNIIRLKKSTKGGKSIKQEETKETK